MPTLGRAVTDCGWLLYGLWNRRDVNEALNEGDAPKTFSALLSANGAAIAMHDTQPTRSIAPEDEC